jgi:hypothetical protein
MLTKILFTLGVVIGVLALFRWQRQRRLPDMPVKPSLPTAAGRQGRPVFRWFAIAVIGLSIAGAGLWLLHAWRAAGEIVTVRVFDAGSGAMTEYQAYRSDLDGRSFRTVDGRRVTLAETERMETRFPD